MHYYHVYNDEEAQQVYGMYKSNGYTYLKQTNEFPSYVYPSPDGVTMYISNDIPEGYTSATPKRFINHHHAIRSLGISRSIDIPALGYAIFTFGINNDIYKNEIDLLADAGILEINQGDPTNSYPVSKYVVKNHSDIYDIYKYEDCGINGYKLYNGEYTKSRLNMFKFLQNRLNDKKKTDALIEALHSLNYSANNCSFTIEKSLIHGYNNTGVNSCMQGNGNYFENFEGSGKLLEFNSGDGAFGRAILWGMNYIDGLPDGCKGFMDRIYPSENHKIVDAFKRYATSNNLLHKRQQSYDNPEQFVWKGSNLNLKLKLTPPNAGTSSDYPYMDTFRGSDDLRIFYSSNDYTYCLNDTEGNPGDYTNCSCCGAHTQEDDIYWHNGDAYCYDCYTESYRSCDCCDESYDIDELEETTHGTEICAYCASDRGYVRCDDVGLLSDDYVYVQDIREHYHSTNGLILTTDSDNYFKHTDDLFFAVDLEVWYEHSNNLVEVNGEFFTELPKED